MIRRYDKNQLPDYDEDEEIDDDPDLGDPFIEDEPDEPDMDWNSPYRGIEEARHRLEEDDDDGFGDFEDEDDEEEERNVDSPSKE